MKKLEMGDPAVKITRGRNIKNVLNTERLRKEEEKLRNGSYTPMKFLKSARHTFATTSKVYFDRVEDILADDPQLGGETQEEEEDEPEVENQVQTRQDCIVCMDRKPEVVLVPCGHQNMCAPCAHQWKDDNGTCPIDRKEIAMIIPLIPL